MRVFREDLRGVFEMVEARRVGEHTEDVAKQEVTVLPILEDVAKGCVQSDILIRHENPKSNSEALDEILVVLVRDMILRLAPNDLIEES